MMPIFGLDFYVTKVKNKEYGIRCREVDTNYFYVLSKLQP